MKKSELLKLSIGQIGNAMAFNLVLLFLPTYFIKQVFTGSPIANTLGFMILATTFIVGSIAFIYAGQLSDRTKTRWGKRRPFFLCAIPSGIGFILLGVILPSASELLMFIFLASMAVVFSVFYRLEFCAYWSLYMDKTEPEERVTASITFNLFGTVGVVGAIALMAIFEIPVIDLGTVPGIVVTLIAGGTLIVAMLFVFLFGPKEDLSKIKIEQERESIISTLKTTAKDRNFFYYMIASFFFVLGYTFSVINLMPFLEATSLNLAYLFPFALPIAVLFFYLISRAANSMGRFPTFKRALIICISTIPLCTFLGIVGTGAVFFVQTLAIVLILLFTVIAILTFQYALLMDLAPEGKEATYSGVYLFVIDIPMLVASLSNGPILDFLEFDFFIWSGASFGFAIIFMITSISLLVSYLFLRKVRIDQD
jgi:maltose/moltooligosaccharide transporter